MSTISERYACATIICPGCNNNVGIPSADNAKNDPRPVNIYQCPDCGQPFVAILRLFMQLGKPISLFVLTYSADVVKYRYALRLSRAQGGLFDKDMLSCIADSEVEGAKQSGCL